MGVFLTKAAVDAVIRELLTWMEEEDLVRRERVNGGIGLGFGPWGRFSCFG